MSGESLKELGPAELRWSGILAGSFFALGLAVLLHALGLAIALSVLGNTARAAATWMGIWILLVPVLALFGGGVLTGRFSGVTNRSGGAVHGAVTWGLSTLIGVILLGVVLTSVVGGLTSLGGAAAQLTGSVVSRVADVNLGQASQITGLDARDFLGPVNEARAARGLPALDPERLQAALRDAVSTSITQGRLDRETLVGALVRNTEISRESAEQVATDIESRADRLVMQVSEAAEAAQRTAASVSWLTFLSSALSLGAAVGGAVLAVSPAQKRPLRLQQQAENRPTATSETEPPPPFIPS